MQFSNHLRFYRLEREPYHRILYIKKRLAVLRQILEWNYSEKSSFVTLTFVNETTEKEAVKAFQKLRQKFLPFKSSGYVFVLEKHPGGHGVHIHAVFFSVPYVRNDELQAFWGAITDISLIKSRKAITEYIASYMSCSFRCKRVFYQSKGLITDPIKFLDSEPQPVFFSANQGKLIYSSRKIEKNRL